MTLTCPHCGYSREVDPARVPTRPVRVSCPGCGGTFPFTPPPPGAGEEPEFPEPVEMPEAAPGLGPGSGPTPGAAGAPAVPPAVAAAWATAALPKAGFWVRAMAAVVDAALVGLIEGALAALLTRAGGIEPDFGSAEGLSMMLVLGLFGTVVGIAYRVAFLGHGGQTPGKMLAQVKVVRTDGSELGYGRAALREVVGKFLSKLILGVGYLMVAFDRQKQGLHDKIADTYVIKL